MKKKTLLVLSLFLTISTITFAQKGECLFGVCDSGYGVMIYANGEKYAGEFSNYQRNGQGVYFFSNGDKYVGGWELDKQNGEGRLYKKSGSIDSGLWTAGVLSEKQPLLAGCLYGNCQNGYGIYLFDNGTKMVGVFENGQPKDQTTVFYPNGAKYVGRLINSRKEGAGALFHPDGLIEEGFWKNDSHHGSLKSQTGCVEGDCVNGRGKYVFPDLTTYKGSFKSEYADGYGECHFSNGDLYIGEWAMHEFHGKGTVYYANGAVQDGYWRGGEFLGGEKPITKAAAPTAIPKVYAVLVGVASYRHMKSLKYTDDDAYRMHAFLKSPEGGALADEQINILIDEDATKANILKILEKVFAKATANDAVVFYFSGHGLKGAFLPIDYDGNNNRLEHAEVMAILDKSPAKYKTVIADACHSGSWGNEKNVESMIETYYQAFTRSSGGTVLMMSSKAEETSIENNGLRQGIFSHFLIRGLKGAADTDKNGIITVEEVFQYVETNVKYYTANYQNPVISGNFDKNMPMGVIRN